MTKTQPRASLAHGPLSSTPLWQYWRRCPGFATVFSNALTKGIFAVANFVDFFCCAVNMVFGIKGLTSGEGSHCHLLLNPEFSPFAYL